MQRQFVIPYKKFDPCVRVHHAGKEYHRLAIAQSPKRFSHNNHYCLYYLPEYSVVLSPPPRGKQGSSLHPRRSHAITRESASGQNRG